MLVFLDLSYTFMIMCNPSNISVRSSLGGNYESSSRSVLFEGLKLTGNPSIWLYKWSISVLQRSLRLITVSTEFTEHMDYSACYLKKHYQKDVTRNNEWKWVLLLICNSKVSFMRGFGTQPPRDEGMGTIAHVLVKHCMAVWSCRLHVPAREFKWLP